jgi:two-component system, cell cycle sensor histidine kinase and response regulator CckA
VIPLFPNNQHEESLIMGIKPPSGKKTTKRFFTNSGRTENKENFPEITRHERLNLLFPDLIDVMDIAMWELDLNYRVVASNKKAKKIYGDHVIGKFCYYAAADRDKICPKCPAKMVYNGCESGRSEHQRTDTTGKKIYIDHIATPIKNKDGQLIGCLVIIIDITNRKLMEKELKRHRNTLEKMISERTRALKQSEEKYRRLYNESKKAEAVYCSLLNSSADAIIIYDLEGRTQYVSSGFTRLFGWSLDELKGKRIDYVPEAELEKSITHINNAIQRGISCPGFESKRYKKDGRLVDVSISASGYTDHEGKLSGLLVILRDISEQKRLEAQLRHSQKMEAIGTLSSGIAHDFNNILSIILGNSELALYGLPKSKSLYSFLEEIRIASLRAKDVVKQLLSFSRKSEENRFPINIVPIVIESLKLLRSSVSANIEFRQNISRNLPTILAEPIQIHQIMINLCTNAVHAMEKTGGYLDVTLENKEIFLENRELYPDLKEGKYLKLSISDNGHGIAPGHLERIFEPYFTTKDIGKGSGMGLAVVHGILKNHDGVIKVNSILDQGTTVDIFFPAIEAQEQPKSNLNQNYPTGNESILIVDDDELILKIEKKILTCLGYRVETFTSPVNALEKFLIAPESFDLAIADMAMPKMTGDKFIRELLKIKPDLPAILCTGYSEWMDENKALEMGIKWFLIKPIDMQKMAAAVKEALNYNKCYTEFLIPF